MKKDNPEMVVIESFNSVNEAQLFKALLDSAGVESYMQNDIAAQVIPAYGAFMQVNVLVARKDEAKAREALQAGFDQNEVDEGTQAKNRDPKE